MAKVTLEQVAQQAQVSRRTVDRVVHNRGNVKPEVEERVREALKELGYERNKIASALASSKYTRRVCIMYQKPVSCYYDEKLIEGIREAEKELRDFGIEVDKVVVDSADTQVYCDIMNELAEKGYSGLALRGPDNQQVAECINRLSKQGIPVVTFNSDIPGGDRVCFVGQNLYQSGRIAGDIMSRLVRRGEKILIGYGDPQYYAHHARVNGFVHELKKAGFEEEDIVIFYTNQEYDVTVACLEQYFTEVDNIRGVYMSIEPNSACGDFLMNAKLKKRPFVICHDIDPNTISYMKKGIFDFVIDQDISDQSYQSLLILKDIFCFGTWHYKNTSGSYIYNAACFGDDEQIMGE